MPFSYDLNVHTPSLKNDYVNHVGEADLKSFQCCTDSEGCSLMLCVSQRELLEIHTLHGLLKRLLSSATVIS